MKNTYDFLVQVRNFLLPLSLNVFWHKEEREAQSFYDDVSICPLTHAAPVAHKFIWPRPGLNLN